MGDTRTPKFIDAAKSRYVGCMTKVHAEPVQIFAPALTGQRHEPSRVEGSAVAFRYLRIRGDPTAIPDLAVKMRAREWFGDLVSTLDFSAAIL